MVQTTQFRIGADAVGSDGVCGEVSRVVVDPIARAVTHLVVEPKHRTGLGRLVPLDLVDATTGELRLRCTQAAFERLESAEETHFLPGNSADADYGPGHTLVWPYFGMGLGGVADPGLANLSQPVTYDKVPLGNVAVRRGEKVHATDGDIGKVEGLVIDPSDRQVTHVILQEGHLWGRKEVAIPIGAVIAVDDGIRLDITKQEVQDLPDVRVDHPTV